MTSIKVCEGSSGGCSSPTCPAHHRSLQKLIESVKNKLLHRKSGWEVEVDIAEEMIRAYELGVVEERARIKKLIGKMTPDGVVFWLMEK